MQPINAEARGRCGGVPVVGFVEDVEFAIPVEVGDAGFVEVNASGETVGRKLPWPSPKSIQAVALGLSSAGLDSVHLAISAVKDVEMAVAVDVGDLEGVAVDHVAVKEVATYPIG